MTAVTVVHIAGEPVTGPTGVTVQRCAWCGAILIGELAETLALHPPVAVGVVPPTFPLFPAGDMVRITSTPEHDVPASGSEWLDQTDTPDDCCVYNDPMS